MRLTLYLVYRKFVCLFVQNMHSLDQLLSRNPCLNTEGYKIGKDKGISQKPVNELGTTGYN